MNIKMNFLIFFLFFSNLISIQYNNIIELHFRPEKKDLENYLSFEDSCPYVESCKIQNENPIINHSSNPILADGLNMYLDEAPGKTCKDMQYCLSKKILNRNLEGISGIFAFYCGYSGISDNEGLLILPSFEIKNKLTIIVTKSIHPAIFSKNIPSYFFIPKNEDSLWYECLGKEKNGSFYWQIENIKIPNNKKVPENALIIIGDCNLINFEKEPQFSAFIGNIIVPTAIVNEKFTRGIYAINLINNLKYYYPKMTKTVKNSSNEKQYAKIIK